MAADTAKTFGINLDDYLDKVEVVSLDEIREATKKKGGRGEDEKSVALRNFITGLRDHPKFPASNGIPFVWNTLPEVIRQKFQPRTEGERTFGGMNAIITFIRLNQDKLDLYPKPMNEDAEIHRRNTAAGDDVEAEDRRYGGFYLVRKSEWMKRAQNANTADAEKSAE